MHLIRIIDAMLSKWTQALSVLMLCSHLVTKNALLIFIQIINLYIIYSYGFPFNIFIPLLSIPMELLNFNTF